MARLALALKMIIFLVPAFILAVQQGMVLVRSGAAKELRGQREVLLEEPVDVYRDIYARSRHMVGFGKKIIYNFVIFSAYRTGPGSFAIVGLADKFLYEKGNAGFGCEWQNGNKTLTGNITKFRTDWWFATTYTAIVVHCNFKKQEWTQGGGELHFLTSSGPGEPAERAIAITEKPGDYNESNYPGGKGFKFKYDYLYCGSSLFGDIDSSRLSQWLAYHAMVLGNKSHIVLHDVGALKSYPENQKVVQPWVKAGRVTVEDFTEQSQYDGWYYNQFVLVNDCFFRHKYDAKWTFFFDVDEYLHIPAPNTLDSVLSHYGKNYTQVMFKQNLMSPEMCLADEAHSGKWEFEKLVFKNMNTKKWRDRKYVIQAALADSAGVHLSQHIRKGKGLYEEEGRIQYYHFHNTINKHKDTCTKFIKLRADPQTWVYNERKVPYTYDNRLASLANAAKEYERRIIGDQAIPTEL